MYLPKEIQLKTGEMFKAGAAGAREMKNKERSAGSQSEHNEVEDNQWETFEEQVEMTRQGNKEAEMRKRSENKRLIEKYAAEALARCPRPPGVECSEEDLLELIDVFRMEDDLNKAEAGVRDDLIERVQGKVQCRRQEAEIDFSEGVHEGREPPWVLGSVEGLNNLIERYDDGTKGLSAETQMSMKMAWGHGNEEQRVSTDWSVEAGEGQTKAKKVDWGEVAREATAATMASVEAVRLPHNGQHFWHRVEHRDVQGEQAWHLPTEEECKQLKEKAKALTAAAWQKRAVGVCRCTTSRVKSRKKGERSPKRSGR